jgi:4-hydroxybenzoate-CoA ligase
MRAQGNAASWFVDRHIAAGDGDRLAFADPARRLTYADLHAASARFAGALAAAGIGRERRIALSMLDTVDFPIAFWGALRAGVVPVPVNTLLPADQLAYVLADSRAEALLISAPLLPPLSPHLAALPALRHVVVANPDGSAPEGLAAGQVGFAQFLAGGEVVREPVACPPDEVAFWLYSAGSTGAPKAAKHVHGSLRATAETYGAQVLGIGRDDLFFSAAKLFFAYGLGNSMTFPMAVGAAAVLLPDRPTPEAVLATMRRFQPTLFGGASVIRNWGRIGSNGQAMMQTFDRPDAADDALRRLERSKRRRGYRDVD